MDLFFMFRNYDKPGPGVRDDEPQKEGAALFFQTLGRKWKPMIRMNLIYIMYSIPMIIALFLLSGIVSSYMVNSNVTKQLISDIAGSNGVIDAASYLRWQTALDLSVRIFLTITGLMLFGSGPASAAMYAVHDCHMRGEPLWLWSDYNDFLRKNMKQELIVAVIDLAFFFLLMTGYLVYGRINLFIDLRIVLTVILALYVMAHMYIYPMMAKYDLSIGALYRNAFIIAVGKLPQSALVLLIWLFMAAFPILAVYIVPGVAVFCIMIYLLLALIFTFSFMTLIAAVNARTQMNKVFK